MLLGAGFAYAATEGRSPLTRDFIGEIDAKRYPQLRRFTRQLQADRSDLGVVLQELDTRSETPLRQQKDLLLLPELDPTSVRQELARYCVERVGAVHRGRFTWPMGSVWNACVDGYTIITTNYDRVADCAVSMVQDRTHGFVGASCGRCKMRHMLSADCPCPPAERVPENYWRGALLKLHGSTDWKICRARCCASGCIATCEPCDSPNDDICGQCGSATEPVVVLPRVRGKYDGYSRLSAMWDAAAQALADAELLVVFGFSFSGVDLELCGLFREAFRSGKLKRVSIMDTRVEKVAEAMQRVLPQNVSPQIEGLDLPEDFGMPGPEKWRRLSGPSFRSVA
jgi:hypothetical protein